MYAPGAKKIEESCIQAAAAYSDSDSYSQFARTYEKLLV